MDEQRFMGLLYDQLIKEDLISYKDSPKDVSEKKQRLTNYLDRLKSIHENSTENNRHLSISMLRRAYYNRYVIKEKNIPKEHFEKTEKEYLNQGRGHIELVYPRSEYDKEIKKNLIKLIIKDQEDSLNNWLNYFLSKESSSLPMWAKVWAFQGMLHIGNLNANKDGYIRRSKDTVNPFVSLDEEILIRCVEFVKDSFEKKDLTDEEIKKIVATGSFSKLYGKLLANKRKIIPETNEGIWIKYNRETEESIKTKLINGEEPEYIKLYNSLQGYSTGWCTAGGRETAKEQILGGDFYVYYSKDKNGQYKIPRLAIRMEGERIEQIRGIEFAQNIESSLSEILEEKLKEIPDAINYKKKQNDYKKLTLLYEKNRNYKELTLEDIKYLYEFDNIIHARGDVRIKEIKQGRSERYDLALLFDCSISDISLSDPEKMGKDKIYYLPKDGWNSTFAYSFENIEKLKIPKTVKRVYLNRLISAKGVDLPSGVETVYLNGLQNAKDLKFPEGVKEIHLNGLESAKDLKFPEGVEKIYLNGLQSAKDLNLPKGVEKIYLNGLQSAKYLKLPNGVKKVYLNGLQSAKYLKLPQSVKNVYLNGLKSAKHLILSTNINFIELNGLKSAKHLKIPPGINSIELNGLKSAEYLKLPTSINSVRLNGLVSAYKLVLPDSIKWLYLNSLKSAEHLELPSSVESVYLNSLKSAEHLELPSSVENVYLNGLVSAYKLVLPEGIIWLHLNSLESAEYLKIPNSAKEVHLNSLKSAKNLKLTQNLDIIYLNGLIDAKDLVLPESAESVHLNGLIDAKDLVLPDNVKYLYLNGLKNAKNLKLSPNIKGLYLESLESLKDLVLPYSYDYEITIVVNGKSYDLNKIKEIRLIEYGSRYNGYYNGYYSEYIKQSYEDDPHDRGYERFCEHGFEKKIITASKLISRFNHIIKEKNSNEIEKRKTRGYISNTLLLINIILFGILVFIISLIIIK